MKVYTLETGIITKKDNYLYEEERMSSLNLSFLTDYADKSIKYDSLGVYYCIFEENINDNAELNTLTPLYENSKKPPIKNWLYFKYRNEKGRIKNDRRRFSKKY